MLHALCDAAPRLGPVNSSLLLLLLRHGADPDACVDGRYPLTSYFDALCRGSQNHAQESTAETRQERTERQNDSTHNVASNSQRRRVSFPVAMSSTSDDVNASELVIDVRRMCRMLGFMSLPSQYICAKTLQSTLTSETRPQPLSSDVTAGLRRALKEVEKYTLAVPSLRRSCSLVVWRHCRRHVGNVYKLPLPMPLINVVMDSL